MLTYSLETHHKEPLYEQLYQAIKSDILQGQLAAHSKLPSKRQLAKHLGISIVTVENSYQQLKAEGFIYSKPKRGFFVSKIQLKQDLPQQVIRLVPNQELRSVEKSNKINLSQNQINPETFPFATWSKLVRRVLNDYQNKLVQSAPSQGIWDLRLAISQHLSDYRGMIVDPQQIVIGAGTDYLYTLLLQLFGTDKRIAIENPGYNKIARIYEQFEVRLDYLPMEANGISLTALKNSQADIVHISPSHQFPTGAVLPINKRYELLSWASQDDNRFIIEDDFDSEFRFGSRPLPSLQEIDSSGKVIYINTFSKSLVPTLRISYMVLPAQLLPKFQTKLTFYSNTVSNLEQYTLANFIKEGYFEKHLNRMRLFYQRKRDKFINKLMQSPLASIITIHNEDAGLHFILSLHLELSDEEICQRAENHGLTIKPLSYFYHADKKEASHSFIINFTNISDQEIERIITILTEICIKKD